MTENQELIEGCARRARENRLGGHAADLSAEELETAFQVALSHATVAKNANKPGPAWLWHEVALVLKNEQVRRLLVAGGEIAELERIFSIEGPTE